MTAEHIWWTACTLVGFVVLGICLLITGLFAVAALVGLAHWIGRRANEGWAILRGRLKFGERP